MALGRGSANVFCKGPENKYSGLGRLLLLLSMPLTLAAKVTECSQVCWAACSEPCLLSQAVGWMWPEGQSSDPCADLLIFYNHHLSTGQRFLVPLDYHHSSTALPMHKASGTAHWASSVSELPQGREQEFLSIRSEESTSKAGHCWYPLVRALGTHTPGPLSGIREVCRGPRASALPAGGSQPQLLSSEAATC